MLVLQVEGHRKTLCHEVHLVGLRLRALRGAAGGGAAATATGACAVAAGGAAAGTAAGAARAVLCVCIAAAAGTDINDKSANLCYVCE